MKNSPKVTELNTLFTVYKFLYRSFFAILLVLLLILIGSHIDPKMQLTLEGRIELIELCCFSAFISFVLKEKSKTINKRIQEKN